MPTLSEIRANPPAPRPERTMEVCLDGAIVAEMERLNREYEALQLEQMRKIEAKAPRKMAEGVDPASAEIRERVAALDARREAASGVLTLSATPANAEWIRFADANPARSDGEPGHDRDAGYAGGRVNIDAVVADLASYVSAWNDESTQPGDWDRLSASMDPATLYDLAEMVVSMYWAPRDFQELRLALSGVPMR